MERDVTHLLPFIIRAALPHGFLLAWKAALCFLQGGVGAVGVLLCRARRDALSKISSHISCDERGLVSYSDVFQLTVMYFSFAYTQVMQPADFHPFISPSFKAGGDSSEFLSV